MPAILLVPQVGIEPTHPAYKTGPLPLRIQGQKFLVRGRRIELLTNRWQRYILPLN